MKLTRRTLTLTAFASLLQAQKPETIPFDLSLLDDGAVANDLFFIRDHFGAPAQVSQADWTLSVGASRFTYEDLLAMPSRTIPAALECAENPVGGGLVGHAQWTGVPLAALLEKAGPTTAAFARFSGADGFSRSVPMAKAAHRDTLIVHSMNGDKLPASHGFPIRAFLPGWYGMDSVKWLRQIDLVDQQDPQPAYVRQVKSILAGARDDGPVREMRIKSAFTRPTEAAILGGRRFQIRGIAWGGAGRVKQVEVSVDNEQTWNAARLAIPVSPYAWTHWVHEWEIPGPGEYHLSVRATDQRGNLQPAQRDSARLDAYEMDTWQRITVTVT